MLGDPAMEAYLRGGAETLSGAVVSPEASLRNMAVWRCVDLISGSIGMLPLYLRERDASGGIANAEHHALYRVLMSRPNGYQTPLVFKAHMQMRALVNGNAYALIVRSRGRVIALNPIDPNRVRVRLQNDWSVIYDVTRPDGTLVSLPSSDILHLRGLSWDGVLGISRTAVAREAIGLAMQAEAGTARLYKNGVMVGGFLQHPGKLGDDAFANLDASLKSKYSGVENAGKWIILEEGMKAEVAQSSARDNQQIETRKFQIEEVARAFGVPRPLLMMDETSWGSGIEQLGILFVRYSLAPWFRAWEEAIALTCLTEAEIGRYYADFDEKEMLRGSLTDQANFYAKALGAGGSQPWMQANEVREDVGLGPHVDGAGLKNPMTTQTTGAGNEPA
ncbi:phage portal protein [Zavarzinia aquatilis]|uniref:Phage portal protein n=2 Tax=Zavarzinia aquatilis TaxID=2211142 RepID=A0A317EDX9_9PROT|nr:phage portal protein [Zavarzinia aquatilis]